MKDIIIYTDGACSGNPGPGGWGAVLIFGEHQKELSGYERATTNNRMELTAVIEAIKALKEPCKIKLHTDSAYVCRAFNDHWIDGWIRNGWKTAAKKDVENQDLWKQLLSISKSHDITWVKVKGHANNPLNNRCDELATTAAKRGKELSEE